MPLRQAVDEIEAIAKGVMPLLRLRLDLVEAAWMHAMSGIQQHGSNLNGRSLVL